MSDDERDIEIESDDEENDRRTTFDGKELSTDRRAHHNALERKRRDHIKDSFSSLRDTIPTMQGDKSSRAQILKKASEYITFMRKKNSNHQQDIEDLKRQNSHLEKQIRVLERAKSSGNYSSAADVLYENGLNEDASSLVSARSASSDQDFANYEGGSDTSESSFGAQAFQGEAAAVVAPRVIPPGQSLLLPMMNEQPPRKKIKS